MNIKSILDNKCVTEDDLEELSGSLILCHSPHKDLLTEINSGGDLVFYCGPGEDDNTFSDNLSCDGWLENIPEFNDHPKYRFDMGIAEAIHEISPQKDFEFKTEKDIEDALTFVRSVIEKHAAAAGVPVDFSIDDSLL
jgi:hypothetical protein